MMGKMAHHDAPEAPNTHITGSYDRFLAMFHLKVSRRLDGCLKSVC